MSVVVVVPCLPVARPHLREAWRSLVGQGYTQDALAGVSAGRPRPDDDDTGSRVSGLLWIARALPVVIDVLAGIEIADVTFLPAVVDVLSPGSAALSRGPLSMVGWRRDDELLVEVIVMPASSLEDASRGLLAGTGDGTTGTPAAAPGLAWADAALVRLAFPIRLGGQPDDVLGDDTDNMKIDVRVRRFSMGKT
jgi:hypothetical protein